MSQNTHLLTPFAGVDGNKEIYSLDHMYQPNNWAAYCSEITPANTLAYIKGPNAWEDAKLKDHRAFLLARLTPACTQLFGHHRLRQLRTKIVNARTEAISSGAQTKDQAQSLSWVRMNEVRFSSPLTTLPCLTPHLMLILLTIIRQSTRSRRA